MKYQITSLFLLLAFLLPLAPVNLSSGLLLSPVVVHAESDEVPAVRAVFQAYRSAIIEGKGEVAVRYISRKTLDYYKEIRELALYGRAPRVMALDLMDRLMIVSLRHRIGAEKLQKMNEEQLFVYSVANGWIGKESVQRLTLANITIDARTAKAAYLFDEKPTGLSFLFYKQRMAGHSILPMCYEPVTQH